MDDGRIPRACAGSPEGTETEDRAAKAILVQLQAMEALSGRHVDADVIEPGSPIWLLDERFTSSHSVSLLLKQALAAAMDNLQALRRLLFIEEPGRPPCYRFYTHAPYSLVRTVIECTTTVLWALLPDDGRERARRSLVLIAREVFNSASFWTPTWARRVRTGMPRRRTLTGGAGP